MKLKKLTNEKAFTLVELLCVVTLLAMITLVAVPVLHGVDRRHNLEIAARAMANDMRRCQQAAIFTGYEHYMEFLLYFDGYNYRVRSTESSRVERIKFPEGVSYHSTTIGNYAGIPRLSFYPNGAPGRAGTVVLQNSSGDLLYVIVTPATGRVRISKTPPDHW